MPDALSDFRPEVRRALPAIMGARFTINLAMRMGYTFLPAFARGAGLSVGAMSATLSARELTALTAPLSGKASDRLGAMTVMTYGALVAAVGLLIATLGAPGLIAGMIVFGFGRTAHQVALSAWIGSVVAYPRRGRATGLIELTWGGSALVGLPLAGLLIGKVGWWAAPGVLGIAAAAFGLRMRANQSNRERPPRVATRKPNMTPTVVAALATNGAMTAAAQFLFLSHGLWLEDTYGLDTAEIGLAIVAVGAIEVVATTGSSRLTDRIGKRRSMLGGTVLMTTALLILAAYSAPPLWLGLVILVVAFLGFEFGIVSALPLVSELDPGARAEMVGRAISISTVIRAVVTLTATALYVSQGFALLMAVAASTGLVAIVLAAFVMVEPNT
ncbi:MAG: MFS transporter [Actinomycetia bacterium]|nr:MFS transporter [Actinomycetes bacterium]